MELTATSRQSRPPTSRESKASKIVIGYERRILLLALLAGIPALTVAMILLWSGNYTPKVQWTLTIVVVGIWWGVSFGVRRRVVLPLQTLSNLLAALREEDYSVRARGSKTRPDDALWEVMVEVNALSETLREQRLGALEATALLRKVMAEINVAVFTFDGEHRLQLVNRAGERLLAQPAERLLGQNAADLGLADCLDGEPLHTVQRTFPGAPTSNARWRINRSSFREHGFPHQLLVVMDLSRPLREEERQAWQRLVRVLGHELNNSLAPIKSMAGSLESLLVREPRPTDWQEDMLQGLRIVGARAESLSRFLKAYSRLARLPQPKCQPTNVGAWVRRVVALETRMGVVLRPGPDVFIEADGDQLDQLLINLLRNAVDAAVETGGGVRVEWSVEPGHLVLRVEDEGPGLSNTSNLFVPFFTTKQGGSGIGLVLSRQIAEAHGGSLTLENRRSGRGCEARLLLPL